MRRQGQWIAPAAAFASVVIVGALVSLLPLPQRAPEPTPNNHHRTERAMIPRKSSGALEWNECRRLVSRLGANLDVVVRSDPEVCGLSGDDFRLSLHHSGHGDCTVGSMSLVDCPNSLVVEEFCAGCNRRAGCKTTRWTPRRIDPPQRADTVGVLLLLSSVSAHRRGKPAPPACVRS